METLSDRKTPLCSPNFCIYFQRSSAAVQGQLSESAACCNQASGERSWGWEHSWVCWDCRFLVRRRVYFCLFCNCLMVMKMFTYKCLLVWTYTRKSLTLDSLCFPKKQTEEERNPVRRQWQGQMTRLPEGTCQRV